MIDDESWWDREPKDLRTGCLVVAAGVVLGWGTVGLIAWALIKWWYSGG